MTAKKTTYYKKVQTTIQAIIDVFMEKILKWGLSFVVLMFVVGVVGGERINNDPEETIRILVILVIGGWVAGLMAGMLEKIDDNND